MLADHEHFTPPQILEQVEGGELVVNKGKDEVPKAGNGKERDLNAVEGFEAAFKLAEVRRSLSPVSRSRWPLISASHLSSPGEPPGPRPQTRRCPAPPSPLVNGPHHGLTRLSPYPARVRSSALF